MFDVKKLENVFVHQWLWLHMWETLWCNKPAIVGNKPRQTHSNSTRPWLDLFMHLETLMLLIIFLVWFASKRQFLMYFFALQLWRRCDPEMGCKHLLTPVSNMMWFSMVWNYCTSFYCFLIRMSWADSGGHIAQSQGWKMLLLSGWCDMLASLADLCWHKLWWSIRFILS